MILFNRQRTWVSSFVQKKNCSRKKQLFRHRVYHLFQLGKKGKQKDEQHSLINEFDELTFFFQHRTLVFYVQWTKSLFLVLFVFFVFLVFPSGLTSTENNFLFVEDKFNSKVHLGWKINTNKFPFNEYFVK